MSCKGHHSNAEITLKNTVHFVAHVSAEFFLSFALLRGDDKDQIKNWPFLFHFLNICT